MSMVTRKIALCLYVSGCRSSGIYFVCQHEGLPENIARRRAVFVELNGSDCIVIDCNEMNDGLCSTCVNIFSIKIYELD